MARRGGRGGGWGDDQKQAVELTNEINKAMSDLLKSRDKVSKMPLVKEDDLKAFTRMTKQAKELEDAMLKAGRLNLRDAAQQIKELNASLNASIEEKKKRLLEISREMNRKGIQARTQLKLAQELKELNAQILKDEKENAEILNEQLQVIKKIGKEQDYYKIKLEDTIFDPEISGRLEGLVDGVRKVTKNVRDFDKVSGYIDEKFQGIAGTIDDITGASLSNLDNLQKKGLGFVSQYLRIKGGQELNLTEGKSGQGLVNIGKTIGSLSIALGGFVAIFTALQGIENAQKGVNKSLIEAGGAMDLLSTGSDSVLENVTRLRETLSDGGIANELGVSLDTLQGYYSDLQGVGLNFRAFKGDLDSMVGLISELRSQSAALGISFGDVAAVAQTFREEVGLVVTDAPFMDRMGDYFARVRDVAAQSTLSTSRFFNVIQGMAEGLGTMNFKVEEAARLFVSLSKVLGPKAGEAFTQGLIGTFKGQGITDRFKTLILTKGSKKIIAQSARESVGELAKNLDATQKGIFQKYKLGAFTNEKGLGTAKDRQGAVEALAKMKDEDFTKMLGELQASGESGSTRARELIRQRKLAQGATGGLGSRAIAMSQLDMGGNFAMIMQNAMSLFGTSISNLGAEQLEALANYTGKGLEELEQMQQIEAMMSGQMGYLKTLTGDDATRNAAIQKAGIQGVQFKDGKLQSLSGEAITDMASFIQAQGSSLDQMVFKADTQNDLLREVVKSTMTSADMISNTLGSLLQQIFDPLSYIATFFGSGTEDKRKNLEQAAEQAQAKLDKLNEDDLKLKDKMRDAEADYQKAMEKEKSVEGRIALTKAFEEQKATDEAALAAIGAERAIARAQTSSLRGAGKLNLEGENAAELFASAQKQAVGKVAQTEMGRKALSGQYGGAYIQQERVRESLRKSGEDYDALVRGAANQDQASIDKLRAAGVDISQTGRARHFRDRGTGTVHEEAFSLTSDGQLLGTAKQRTREGAGWLFSGKEKGVVQASPEETATEQVRLLTEMADREKNPEVKRSYQQQIAAIALQEMIKDKRYWKEEQKTQVKAYLEAEKEKAEIDIKSAFGQLGVGDFSQAANRQYYRQQIEAMTDPSERSRLRRGLGLIESYYKEYDTESVEDGRMNLSGLIEASKTRPVAIRGGSAMLGHPMDNVTMSKGGGNKPNVTININGGNQAEVISTVTKVLQMSGYNA